MHSASAFSGGINAWTAGVGVGDGGSGACRVGRREGRRGIGVCCVGTGGVCGRRKE